MAAEYEIHADYNRDTIAVYQAYSPQASPTPRLRRAGSSHRSRSTA